MISGLHLAPILFDPYRNLLVPIVADIKFELYSRISPNDTISQFSIQVLSVINLFGTSSGTHCVRMEYKKQG